MQTVGMAQDFYENSVLSKEVFDKADQVLDFDIKKICFQENQEINDTEYTQAALVTTYLAITKEVESRGIKPDVAAGLSLGEYAAIAVSGWLFLRRCHKNGKTTRNSYEQGCAKR